MRNAYSLHPSPVDTTSSPPFLPAVHLDSAAGWIPSLWQVVRCRFRPQPPSIPSRGTSVLGCLCDPLPGFLSGIPSLWWWQPTGVSGLISGMAPNSGVLTTVNGCRRRCRAYAVSRRQHHGIRQQYGSRCLWRRRQDWRRKVESRSPIPRACGANHRPFLYLLHRHPSSFRGRFTLYLSLLRWSTSQGRWVGRIAPLKATDELGTVRFVLSTNYAPNGLRCLYRGVGTRCDPQHARAVSQVAQGSQPCPSSHRAP